MSIDVYGQLTVYFDCPFWVAVFERFEGGNFQICRMVIGTSEPKDYDVYSFVLDGYYHIKFSKSIKIEYEKTNKPKNPKRVQREISKALQNNGISKKSYEAIRGEREESKIERKKHNKALRLKHQKELFNKKKIKKKEKRKGH